MTLKYILKLDALVSTTDALFYRIQQIATEYCLHLKNMNKTIQLVIKNNSQNMDQVAYISYIYKKQQHMFTLKV